MFKGLRAPKASLLHLWSLLFLSSSHWSALCNLLQKVSSSSLICHVSCNKYFFSILSSLLQPFSNSFLLLLFLPWDSGHNFWYGLGIWKTYSWVFLWLTSVLYLKRKWFKLHQVFHLFSLLHFFLQRSWYYLHNLIYHFWGTVLFIDYIISIDLFLVLNDKKCLAF